MSEEKKEAVTPEVVRHHPLNCSFCGRSQAESRFLIQGPGVIICDDCVWLCVDVLNDKGVYQPEPPKIEK